MRAERPLLRIGEYLVGRACQQLPRRTRERQYQEWVAELPVILHDPQIRLAPRRVVRMLGYAADTLRGVALTYARAHPRRAAGLCLLFVVDLALLIGSIWIIVVAPDDPLNYLRLAWVVLLAGWPLYLQMRYRARRLISSGLAIVGMAVCLWSAAQAPGYYWVWVNYLGAALLFLLLPQICILAWIRSRQARTTQAGR